VDEEELLKFWKSSATVSRSRNFLRILQHCEIGHYSIILLISLEKTAWIFMKRCIVGHGDKKVPVRLWKSSG